MGGNDFVDWESSDYYYVSENVSPDSYNGTFSARDSNYRYLNSSLIIKKKFCSGTCFVMFGIFTSVAALLNKNNPDIVIVKCHSHLQHLCAKITLKWQV